MGTRWLEHADGLAWEESELLHQAGLCHGVAGRNGGVSQAPYDSLNLALHVGDSIQAVLENRRRLCTHIGASLNQLTTAQQVHTDHVVAVGKAEIGRGAGSYADAFAHTDALMTNVPGAMFFSCIADCVQVILFDPVQKACAVVHDGWRGTAARLAAKTVFAMESVYGSRPGDILAYVGPSISRSHFAVSESTADAFRQLGKNYAACVYTTDAGQIQVDLWQANRQLLVDAGVQAEHIDVTTACAYEEADRFYSYRRDHSITGRMGAFAMLTPGR